MSQAKSSTLRQLLVQAEETFHCQDAFRYKVKVSDKEGKKQVEIQAKMYQELRQDTQKVSALLETLGERGSHIAIIGATSYSWVVSYFGIVNSGRVAVPLDALLPPEDICELIRRADVEILIFDGSKSAVAAAAKQACPQLRYLISMEESLSPKAGDLKDLLFLCYRSNRKVIAMNRLPPIWQRLCLPQEQQERVRESCSLTGIWQKMPPAWIWALPMER